MKCTIIHPYRGQFCYARISLDEVYNLIKDGSLRPDPRIAPNKQICFSAEWRRSNGQSHLISNNHLILLQLRNLFDLATAEEYKRQASLLPYTLLAFIGSDGRSVNIVCPYDAYDETTDNQQQALTNAYRKLHFIYSAQLSTRLHESEPQFDSSCLASHDPSPVYHPSANAIIVSADKEQTLSFKEPQETISDYNYPEEIPGLSVLASRSRRFHDCLDTAIEENIDKEGDEFILAVTEQLADGCHQMGLPESYATRTATFIPMLGGKRNEEMIRSAFRTAYMRDMLKTMPTKFTRPSALLTFKTEAYMKEHYTLRLNVMTGVPEYRKNAIGYGFQPLDQAARNTMSILALKAGVDSWDKDLNRYIDSDIIPKYYPMEDYLCHLPRWDGKHDWVGELAKRVKTDNKHWEEHFHTWMLSMVAQWRGLNLQHGNAIVPLLIGPQGSGKTTFCRRLLPEYLQTYFNDRISMKNDNDIFTAMSSFALINIDEFDSLKKSQQPLLKYLLSKHDVKMRPPYGKIIQQRQRFASFIATTNCRRPLTDPTGSRRFVCAYADEIDNSGKINHDMVYAQLCQELDEGRRYWLSDEDNAHNIKHNAIYQQVNDHSQMVTLTHLTPEDTPSDTAFVPLYDILERLRKEFPTFAINRSTDRSVGRCLHALGYEHKKTSKGIFYKIKAIQP